MRLHGCRVRLSGNEGSPEHHDREAVNEAEADVVLRHTSDVGLLKTFAVLTHRLHVADRKRTAAAPIIRQQRNHVESEILRRMANG